MVDTLFMKDDQIKTIVDKEKQRSRSPYIFHEERPEYVFEKACLYAKSQL